MLRAEIERTFDVVPGKSTDHEIWFVCPECNDRDGHRSVNVESGQTYCFKCGKGAHQKGNFLAWSKALGYAFSAEGGVTYIPLEKLVEGSSTDRKLPPVTKVAMPDGFTLLSAEPDSAYARLIGQMAVRKNLLLEDFVEAGAGFTRDDPRWEPFCIFPVLEHGIPVYFQGRTYTDIPGESTKLFPSRDKVEFGAAYWVYNLDALDDPNVDTAIVVESVLNVLSLRWKLRELGWTTVAPVCVFKHNVSRWQYHKLTRYKNIKEVCMMFDHDAIASAWVNAADIGHRVRVTAAEMPATAGNKKTDPNDDVNLAIEVYQQRTRVDANSITEARIMEKTTKPVWDMRECNCAKPGRKVRS
jgi:hypothetical protein